MDDVAVMLKVQGWRCLVIGGGNVAVRRACRLAAAGADVVVVAPDIDDRLRGLAEVSVHERAFAEADVRGARLVVIATDDPVVNVAAAAAAAAVGALVNRADDPAASDVQFLATRQAGPVTLAVHSGGASASAAAQLAEAILANMDPDWPVLIETAAAYRSRIQQRFPPGEARQSRLRKLADSIAMRVLKEQGPAGLDAYCQRLADPDAESP